MNRHTIKELEIRVRRQYEIGEEPAPYNVKVVCPENVLNVARQVLDGSEQEHFLVFLLDIRNKVIGYLETHRGGLDTCPVDPRVVFRAAVAEGAAGIIAVHNHPSGDPTPSEEDFRLTKRLVKAGELLGVKVLDHVVVAGTKHYSFAAAGKMA